MNTQARRLTLWPEAILWLLLLVPFFFFTYGQTNTFTATRVAVPTLVFDWEKHIPFLPFSIIPYWSLDLLYGLSLFVCTSRTALRRLVLRLMLASIIACSGFLLFPLQFGVERPPATGAMGWLFTQLEQFDLPYNQAPSLHIILSWLLWLHFRPTVKPVRQWMVDIWFLLIALSVLTTWQHHVIDVASGLLAGVFIGWSVPNEGRWQWSGASLTHYRLARRYGMGALLLILLALWYPLMWWPALAMTTVALAYAGAGVGVMQKQHNGRLTPSVWMLLLPWRLMMRLSRLIYTRRLEKSNEVIHGVFIGCYPTSPPAQRSVLDLTCEFSRARASVGIAYRTVPMLDLVIPTQEQLAHAVADLEKLHQQHATVLVHCALGLSRSALVIGAWLLTYHHASSPAHAISLIRRCRPAIVITTSHLECLEQWNPTQPPPLCATG